MKLSHYSTNRGCGVLYHVVSSESHHYMVDRVKDSLGAWFMGSEGVRLRVLRIPHKDFADYKDGRDLTGSFNTGHDPYCLEEALSLAQVEYELDLEALGSRDLEPR